MTTPTLHHVTHDIETTADPDDLFDLLLDAGRWPQILAPTIHVSYLEPGETQERLRIWARANDDVRSWESHRRIDRGAGQITFAQVTPRPPVATMTGRWTVQGLSLGRTRLVLDHSFSALDDDPDGLAWIAEATETNSTRELEAMKQIAETVLGDDDITFDFADTVTVDGIAEDVYDFLYDGDRWPERLDHVASVEVTTHPDAVQGLGMDTLAPDGSTHHTHSYRVCHRPATIAYKQTETPPLLRTHVGRWTISPSPVGVEVTSWHGVTLNPDKVEAILGDGKTVADARAYVQHALSANSGKTLAAAKAWAESRQPQGVGGRA